MWQTIYFDDRKDTKDTNEDDRKFNVKNQFGKSLLIFDSPEGTFTNLNRLSILLSFSQNNTNFSQIKVEFSFKIIIFQGRLCAQVNHDTQFI